MRAAHSLVGRGRSVKHDRVPSRGGGREGPLSKGGGREWGGELTPYEVAAVQCGGCGGSWVTGARSQEDRRWREIPPGRQEREGITHTRGSYLHWGGGGCSSHMLIQAEVTWGSERSEVIISCCCGGSSWKARVADYSPAGPAPSSVQQGRLYSV